MRIHLLADPTGPVIAREEQMGDFEGTFSILPAGFIAYRHPADNRAWFAGESVLQFSAAAKAWNQYADSVVSVPETAQAECVVQLRGELQSLGVLDHENSVWVPFLDQAEDGLL